MIVTFTPNPALDLTLLVRGLQVGAVNRSKESHLDPGGKGINVSRVVHRLGGATIALGVFGGHVGKLAERALRKEGIAYEFLWIRAETRLNVILQDTDTRAGTRVYDQGPAVGADTLERMDQLLDRRTQGATVFVASGSVCPGMPDDLHVASIRRAQERGAQTILDASGKWLDEALAAEPDLIKPNAREAGEVLGRTLDTEEAVIAGARELITRGPRAVVISRGGDGAILATPDGVWKAVPPPIKLRSTVGSGDSMVAGLALAMARGEPLSEGLRVGSAAGAATATSLGTELAGAADIRELLPRVVLEEM